MIGNKKLAIPRYEIIVPLEFLLHKKKKKNSSPWKIKVKFCIFPNHGSGEIFPVMNGLMICKCVRSKCLNKGEVVQQHCQIMWQNKRSVSFVQEVQ